MFCALIPWQLFAHALITSGNSLVANQELISKVYFPRVFLPVAPVVVGLVDFGLAFLILLAMMLWHGIMPGPAVLVLPPLVIFAIVTALAVGIWLSAVNLRYRDVGYTLPFLSQLWLFATPVAYSSSIIPESWRGWYGLNPMVGVIEGFRWALLGVEQTSGSSTLVSLMVVTVLLAGGLRYFQASERQFADVV